MNRVTTRQENGGNHPMPTLIIDNVPASLFDRIQQRAQKQQRTPADTVLEVLETAFRTTTPTFSDAPLPSEPFMTEEICAPFSLPWPEGEPVVPVHIAKYIPEPHDTQDLE
jgi:hypothetical protein